MKLAIASNNTSAAAGYAGGKPSAGSQQAQLQRLEQQLSDCVNCATAKTPRGKSDIAAITARISQLQKNIDDSAGNAPARPAETIPNGPAAAAKTLLGSRIDVFA